MMARGSCQVTSIIVLAAAYKCLKALRRVNLRNESQNEEASVIFNKKISVLGCTGSYENIIEFPSLDMSSESCKEICIQKRNLGKPLSAFKTVTS